MFARRVSTSPIRALTCAPLNYLFLILILTALVEVAEAAPTKNVTIQFSGILSPGSSDTIGAFGPINGTLSNTPFTLSVTYNPVVFVPAAGICMAYSYSTNTPAGMVTSLTINGQTVTITNNTSPSTICPNTANLTFSSGITDIVDSGTLAGTSPFSITADFVLPDQTTGTLANPGMPYVSSPAFITLFTSKASETLQASVGGLSIVSPYLIGPSDDLPLSSIFSSAVISPSITASGLSADNTSAAIVLFQVSSDSPVTFSSNNGSLLYNYTSSFMRNISSSASGKAQLQIKPTSVGAAFFAAVLLQGPPAGATPNYSMPITVTAQQPKTGMTQQISIPLLPPPVMLIHGIWSDHTALSAYQTALQSSPPWNINPSLIFATQYPSEKAFYDPGSVSQINTDAASLISKMQGQGIVGGRLDAIAHSMGGLLVRAYSGVAGYREVNNRNQGTFHAIVTLDTPEAGSALATELLGHANSTISKQALKTSLAGAWAYFCESPLHYPSIKTKDCFNNNGKPIDQGAVASLEPTNPVLLKTRSPNITDSQWYDLEATNTTGKEHYNLSVIIEAVDTKYFNMFATNQDPLSAILGGPNDDIVALSSQQAGAPPNSAVFSGLAHSAAFSDPSVTNAPQAISQALCWLNPAGASCKAKLQLVAEETGPTPRFVFGRLSVSNQPSEGELGKPFTVQIAGRGLKSLRIIQEGPNGHTHAEEAIPIVSGEQYHDVSVIPEVVGAETVRVLALFSDGSTEERYFTLNNRLSPSSIRKLEGSSFPKLIMTLTADAAQNTYQLYPSAEIQGLTTPVDVGTMSQFQVIAPASDSPIMVDAKGVITALHHGIGTVRIFCKGHADDVLVEVR